MALAFYTHSLAFLNLLALNGFALTQRVQWQERRLALLVANGAIVVLFAPWLAILVQQAARVQRGFWGTTPSPLVLLTTPYLFLFANAAPAWAVPFTLFITFALLGVSGVAVWRALRANEVEKTALVFTLMVLGVPLITLYILSLVRPMFVERTLIAASFGLYLGLGWLATRVTLRVMNIALVGLLLATMVAVLPNYYFNPEAHKPPMREAAHAVAARFQAGDVVVCIHVIRPRWRLCTMRCTCQTNFSLAIPIT